MSVRLGIDVDGVLYEFVESYRNWLCKLTGRPASDFPDAESWSFYKEQWGLTSAEYIDILVQGVNAKEVFWRGNRVPGSLEAVTQLYREGYEIVIITAREYDGILTHPRFATEHWLGINGYPYHELIVSHDKTKAEYNLDILIDDSPTNLENHGAAGLRAVAFDQRWNHLLKDHERCIGWPGVIEFVHENFPLNVANSAANG